MISYNHVREKEYPKLGQYKATTRTTTATAAGTGAKAPLMSNFEDMPSSGEKSREQDVNTGEIEMQSFESPQDQGMFL